MRRSGCISFVRFYSCKLGIRRKCDLVIAPPRSSANRAHPVIEQPEPLVSRISANSVLRKNFYIMRL